MRGRGDTPRAPIESSPGVRSRKMEFDPPHTSLAGEAYSIIRPRIVCGAIPPGQTISRRRVAAELCMSFLSVTEAMLRPEFEGLVVARPRSGSSVRLPSRDAS